MKKRLTLLHIFFLTSYCSFSQSVAIGTDKPDASAVLDITAVDKGLLIPRMSTAAILAIANPARGLLIFDSVANQLVVNMGTPGTPNWQQPVGSNGSAWSLTGNNGINPANQFVGTTDNQPLRFRINDIQAGELQPGTGNISWGLRAGQANTSGFSNIAIGVDALKLNTVHSNLVAIGDSALFNNGDAALNVAIGSKAMLFNTIGSGNTAVGFESLKLNTTGSVNTAFGTRSLLSNTTGRFNTATGSSALFSNTSGESNTATGNRSLLNNKTGNDNTGTGNESLNGNTTGNLNTAVGSQSLLLNSTGAENTGAGAQSLRANIIGNDNTAVGYKALFSNTGSFNTASGAVSLQANTTGGFNTAFGYRSLFTNTTGSNNTATGTQSLFSNSSGLNNTATGFQSLFANIDGINNTALGASSLSSNTSGFQNTAVGGLALSSNSIGSSNTAIGYGADVSTGDLTNATAIGEGAIVDGSNKIRLGNSAVTVIEGQVPFTTPSDGRFKYQVREDVKGLDFIMQLRPVTYLFDVKRFDRQMAGGRDSNSDVASSGIVQASYDEAASIRRTGFIAQEVEKAAKSSGYDFSGIIKPKTEQDHYSLSYESFVVPLVKAMQEQQQLINELQVQNEELKKLSSIQQSLTEDLLKRLQKLEALTDSKK